MFCIFVTHFLILTITLSVIIPIFCSKFFTKACSLELEELTVKGSSPFSVVFPFLILLLSHKLGTAKGKGCTFCAYYRPRTKDGIQQMTIHWVLPKEEAEAESWVWWNIWTRGWTFGSCFKHFLTFQIFYNGQKYKHTTSIKLSFSWLFVNALVSHK